MNKVKVLDCTLRDGGYCNQWKFGFKNTKKIIRSLLEAHIDIIECGFLTNKVRYQIGVTKFNTMEQLATVIPKDKAGKMFVAMINYGEYNLDDLPQYDGTSIDGIRVAFNKQNRIEALEICRIIMNKGYKVFCQAMVSLSYIDEEFLDLIRRVNEICPYSFYIVDSFGMMKRKDLIRLFYMVERNINKHILIGFHSHNNMQLSYSNAQTFVDVQTNQDLIIDTSVLGMGRGAGNLNTELFIEYLNDNLGTHYLLKPLLHIIDEVLNKFYCESYWGYSLPNYLSAAHNTHPNYATYLDDKNTLTVENMDEIFSMMSDEKRDGFDKTYIEELYIQYMAKGKINDIHLSSMKDALKGKKVLIIGPGRSVIDEKEKVIKFARCEDVVSISINFDYLYYDTNYIFLSNLRRFRELDEKKKGKIIVTSNIPSDDVYLKVKYTELLNDVEAVRDNAGMMIIKYLIKMGVREVVIAGIDGYSHDSTSNYAEEQMALNTKNAVLDAMNAGMKEMLKRYSREIKISYLTTQKHIQLEM